MDILSSDIGEGTISQLMGFKMVMPDIASSYPYKIFCASDENLSLELCISSTPGQHVLLLYWKANYYLLILILPSS